MKPTRNWLVDDDVFVMQADVVRADRLQSLRRGN